MLSPCLLWNCISCCLIESTSAPSAVALQERYRMTTGGFQGEVVYGAQGRGTETGEAL